MNWSCPALLTRTHTVTVGHGLKEDNHFNNLEGEISEIVGPVPFDHGYNERTLRRQEDG